ncbi:hypothetical protein [Nocardia sp. NPDC052566]|uniref:hypothetical protein n=1 Tax=Nocardia sp. NPDC052566 TaxID=3364330 RepID=UPI0037C83B76
MSTLFAALQLPRHPEGAAEDRVGAYAPDSDPDDDLSYLVVTPEPLRGNTIHIEP